MTSTRILALIASIAMAPACGSASKFTGDAGHDTSVPDTHGDVLPDRVDTRPETTDPGTDTPMIDRPVDILVVVDNSMSMAEEQARLTENFPTLISGILDPGPGIRPVADLHIGVVSSDMGTGGYSVETCADPVDGDDGELMHDPNPAIRDCETSYPLFLAYEADSPDAGLIAWMTKGFECIATLGTDGCGFEQQLKAGRRALVDHADGVNAGFLRDGSILAIVFLSDEDDCSVAAGHEAFFDLLDPHLGHPNLRCHLHPEMLDPPATYAGAFRSLRSTPDDLLMAFIVGVPTEMRCQGTGDSLTTCLTHPDMLEQVDPGLSRLLPACTTLGTDATPARRFVTLAQEFGSRAYVQSICNESFAPTVGWLMEQIQARAGG